MQHNFVWCELFSLLFLNPLRVLNSVKFIAPKPPNNRNKLCVFFFIITQSLIFLYFEIEYEQ